MKKLRLLVIEIGIRDTQKLHSLVNTPYTETAFADSILDVIDQLQTRPPHVILISDFRGKAPTAGYIRTFQSTLPEVRIIILIDNPNIDHQESTLYYIQRGASCVVNYTDFSKFNRFIFKTVMTLQKHDALARTWRKSTALAISWLKDNFDSCGTFAELEKITGYSLSSLQHYIRQDTGKSMGLWVRELRIKGAVNLLENSDYPLKLIATQIGYRSIPGFLKAFRAETGKKPSEYRNGR
jgi:AraC-like DNA-binding protein